LATGAEELDGEAIRWFGVVVAFSGGVGDGEMDLLSAVGDENACGPEEEELVDLETEFEREEEEWA
jgi:hypothetical protein